MNPDVNPVNPDANPPEHLAEHRSASGGAAGFRRRVRSLVRKEFRQLLRDRANLMIGIGLPIVLILIFGYGLSLDVKEAPVAVVLEDASPTAFDVIAGLQLSPYVGPRLVKSMAEAETLMNAREVDGIVQVPADFSRRFAAGDGRIQLLLQGADPTRANIIRGYVSGALALWAQKQADRDPSRNAGGAGTVVVVQRMWFNAANTSTWYLVPGLVVLIMTLVGAFLTALVMAREWERGTLEALFVTPVHPVEVLLSKTIPYFCVGMLGLLLCLLAAKFLFAVPLYGSLIVLTFSCMLYMLVALGIGLVISSTTKNQFVASQVALLASFMPAMMLSGFMFDLRNVPLVVRLIGNALPATYFMELIKTLFLAGDNWPLIFKDCAILAGYAAVLLGLAHAVTRKKLD
ncbi:MAG: transporter permease [Betaproteobacteria bacterium]|nr:transporter permease [Betaproteobacteria bacterium]